MTSGRCRFCLCTDRNACPQGTDPITGEPTEGCGWVDRRETLCTACVAVAHAWHLMTEAPRRPGALGPFFRGFMEGSCDERANRFVVLTGVAAWSNPYAPGAMAIYWEIGYAAGVQEIAEPV